jgi:hypothetical protein
MKELTSDEWLEVAGKSFWSVFQNTNAFDAPVRQGMQAKALLYPVSYLLDENEFAALASAAQAEGDDSLYLSITEEFADYDGTNASHWLLNYWEYSEYCELDRIGVLENAMYSPAGRWGILISQEQHAIAAGTKSFIESLHSNHPEWRESLTAFTEDWRHRRATRQADVSWVRPLLTHVYGSSSKWGLIDSPA